MVRQNFLYFLLTLVLFNASAHAKDRAHELFGLCASCHGEDGRGNAKVGAPSIAGVSEWYILAQLEKFKSDGRGKHPNDDFGNRMRKIAAMLRGDDAKIIAAYVSKLPATLPPSTLGGDVEKGKALFMVCQACHGQNGEGNEALNAPSLKMANDWYLVRQLGNFKGGMRGNDASKDPIGARMPPMAAGLPDEQAMKDVIAYVQSLK